MAKRSKRGATLPRVTVLSMSRKELVAFTSAVQECRVLRLELAELVQELGGLLAGKRRAKTSAAAIPDNTTSGAPAERGTSNGQQ